MNERGTASAPGKIILSGEYAVVFGKRGIAVPSKESVTITWTKDAALSKPQIVWEGGAHAKWIEYIERILRYLKPHTGPLQGTLTVDCHIPLGKGMGSSTALVIAVSRCMLGDMCKDIALEIEDQINPGHGGIDFEVIWENAPIVYERGKEPRSITLSKDILTHAKFIDSGMPNETTKELIAWMKTRGKEIEPAIEIIGNCTERLLKSEPLHAVLHDHHRAQVALGIVPESALRIIERAEREGGCGKVIGAGGRTGGGGMVLVLPPLAE